MKTFYHSADLDGHCSGAIVKRFFPETELIGINYGDPFPWERIRPGEEVWMVDFSLQPFSDMQRLNAMCALTWIDHHKTSIDDHNKVGFIASKDQRLSLDHAACEITWMKCMNCWNTAEIPCAVRYLGRYDIWKHSECPGALEFQYGMRFQEDTRPENQVFWETLFSDKATHDLVQLGRTILTHEERQNAKACAACSFEVDLGGLHCIAINKPLTNSLTFKSVYDPARHDAMLSFYLRRVGQWTVSLYSDKPTIDVSAICKARGGGGHKGAAGFTCERLPWEEEPCA